VILFAVNDQREAIDHPLDFSAFGRHSQTLEVWTLADTRHAGEPDATNSFADPDRVMPVRSTFEAASPQFTYHFPPLSLTVMRWSVR
jgi:alpha-L-arabinofuranosidase